MENTQLKINFHQLIDRIDNETILNKFFGLMVKASEAKEGELWGRLSEEEQNELILSDIESEYPENIIPQTDIQKKHSKWL